MSCPSCGGASDPAAVLMLRTEIEDLRELLEDALLENQELRQLERERPGLERLLDQYRREAATLIGIVAEMDD